MDKNSGQRPNLPPEAMAMLKNPEALRQMLQSKEAQALISLLSQQNGEKLRQAARQASRGDLSSLTEMVNRATAEGQGAKLAEELQRKAQNR